MATGKFISYLRVSTERQGRSGLGLEAQRKAVADYLDGGRWKLLAEFVEIESGKRNDRPKLAEAFQLCRVTGATLLIAKLDRLSRNAHFLLGLKDAGIDFVAVRTSGLSKKQHFAGAGIPFHRRDRAASRRHRLIASLKRADVGDGFPDLLVGQASKRRHLRAGDAVADRVEQVGVFVAVSQRR